MQRLVEQFYPRTVRDRLVHIVATERGMQPHRVLIDEDAQAASERLRRQTLFMGLSDGARIDTIRHANSGLLGNEQFVQGTQVDTEKWKDLLDNLRDDLKDRNARFRLVFLVDDFAGSGTSFLRFDKETSKWKGKLLRFKDSVESANDGCDSRAAVEIITGIPCAMVRRFSLAGANPAQQLRLRLVAARAVYGGNDMD